uniref:Beta-lactamase n=1 Tax=Aureoumbra lagunensis TaxID=44058 RepID=A0A7S3K066_9STRA|mmetsp:Transcript_18359/g.23881  ORF Transcript_18359/g.23881 Transcript_18359/m.23881 type:complete len:239 (-) Transcript_18359:97-813(-)
MPLELRDTLPADYENRIIAASADCIDKDKGSGDACHAVGEFFAVIRKDYVKARESYATNCDIRSHSASCFNLGRLLLGGQGGGIDEKGAARRFSQACDNGFGPACHHLGLIAIDADDYRKGYRALERACSFREAESCYIIGSRLLKAAQNDEETSFFQRRIVPWFSTTNHFTRDVPRAQACLEIACDEGHAPACHNLAVLFKHGDDQVLSNETKHLEYKKKTLELVKAAGAMQGVRIS